MTKTTAHVSSLVRGRLREIVLEEKQIVAAATARLGGLKAEREQLLEIYEAAADPVDVTLAIVIHIPFPTHELPGCPQITVSRAIDHP